MTYSILAEGLVKRFGDTVALDGIDLAVRTGSVFGLLGPNGAGKTTAVRILATLVRPDDGHAAVCGHDVVSHAHQVRQLTGLTGQYASVDESLTGLENLMLIGRLTGQSRPAARARARELLAAFRLTDAGDRAVKTYSGGMRRRLDLAASLVTRPRVLYLDEPTTGLDPRSRNEMWDVVRGLTATGVTVLLTTQYLEEADQLADEIAVIDHGTVIATGTPTELKARTGALTLSVRPARVTDVPAVVAVVTAFTRADPEVRGATGLSTDLEKGFFDRLRSLPIARFAPLSGRILADLAKQAWAFILLLVLGLALGFRIGTGPLGVLAAFGLVLVCTLAISWALVLVAMLAANPEKVQIFGFVVLFPITFTSDAFVPTSSMPGWLQAWSKANPVSVLSDAVRGLMVSGPAARPVAESLLWAAAFTIVFAPLAVRAFKRRGRPARRT